MSERTVKCPICAEPYKVFDFYAGDQSACPDCRRKADEKMQHAKPGTTNDWKLR